MGYLHIDNLYRPEAQTILLFKKVYCLEKIHGTSAHISWLPDKRVQLFSGGESHVNFAKLFDEAKLATEFAKLDAPPEAKITVFGEAYGGKQQGMSGTYGKELKFIVFDVQVGDMWLSVPMAEAVAKGLGLEFIHYVETTTDLKDLDEQMDAPSVQAVRNGITEPKKREGIVIRPLVEMTTNNGRRIIAKHKGDEFKETATTRAVVDPNKQVVWMEAEASANEWVVKQRLSHVLDKIPGHDITKMRQIINAMVEDVMREGSGEIVDSPAVRQAIGKKTATMYKNHLQETLVQTAK